MKIAFFVPNLLSWSGEEKIIGGLERYSWSLIKLMQEMGWHVEVNQNGSHDWQRNINGVLIKGHGVARFSPAAVVEKINSHYDHILYGSILQQGDYYKKNSIVISHGVWWDGNEIDIKKKKYLIKLCQSSLEQVNLMISCDYNFLNVMRAVLPGLTEKIRVIPNFVDINKFKPINKNNNSEKIKILYPRRLDYCRGTDIFIQLANRLISSRNDIEILMAVDENKPESNQQLSEFFQKPNVHELNPSFEEMPEIYQQADIVIIPSRYSEGTSFSCLEAMATGKAIIATDVGGLSNLIINGYNGLLVPPRTNAIEKAVLFLLNNPDSANKLAKRARETAKAFTLERWKKHWAAYLSNIYACGEK